MKTLSVFILWAPLVSLQPLCSFAQTVTSISGTTDQIIASSSTGDVTLSLPQSLGTTSSPTFAGGTFTGNLNLSDSKYIYFNQKGSLNYFQSSSSSTFGAIRFDNLFGVLTPTSSVATELGVGTTFSPTSGEAVYNTFLFNPIINQTGGASGVTRGLLIDPTITAAADFRAIEVTRGNVILGSSSGNVGIGTVSPLAMLDISATTGGSSMFRVKGYSDASTPYLLNLGTQSYQDNFQVKMVNGFKTIGNTLNYALGLTTNNIERFRIDNNGNIGIGTATPDEKLTVAGNIHSREVKVTATAGADFVFEENYKLRSLLETENFIKQNKHLPEIASADEMKNNGIQLGEMNIKLLQKIEELTLYLIEKDKQVIDLQKRIKKLESK